MSSEYMIIDGHSLSKTELIKRLERMGYHVDNNEFKKSYFVGIYNTMVKEEGYRKKISSILEVDTKQFIQKKRSREDCNNENSGEYPTQEDLGLTISPETRETHQVLRTDSKHHQEQRIPLRQQSYGHQQSVSNSMTQINTSINLLFSQEVLITVRSPKKLKKSTITSDNLNYSAIIRNNYKIVLQSLGFGFLYYLAIYRLIGRDKPGEIMLFIIVIIVILIFIKFSEKVKNAELALEDFKKLKHHLEIKCNEDNFVGLIQNHFAEEYSAKNNMTFSYYIKKILPLLKERVEEDNTIEEVEVLTQGMAQRAWRLRQITI
jgi:hypothetical protein